jgi:MacB-like periplasmic core domain
MRTWLKRLAGLVGRGGSDIDSSWLDYRDIRDRSRAFEGVLAFTDRPLRLGPDATSTRVWALFVSGNDFDVLDVQPEAGRFFNPAWEQERPGARPVAVISDGLWARQFQSLLIGVGPADLSTRLLVAGVLGVTALLAAYVPARRALAVDPLTALRQL